MSSSHAPIKKKKDAVLLGGKGHRERLRYQFFLSSGESLCDYQLLELLLSYILKRVDTRILSKTILKKLTSLLNLCHQPLEKDLSSIKGVGSKTIDFLSDVQKLMRSFLEPTEKKHTSKIFSPRDLMHYIQEEYLKSPAAFYLIFLNIRSEIIINLSFPEMPSIKTILTESIRYKASSFFIGCIQIQENFTMEDNAILKQLTEISEYTYQLNIKFLDFLLIKPQGTYYSIQENNPNVLKYYQRFSYNYYMHVLHEKKRNIIGYSEASLTPYEKKILLIKLLRHTVSEEEATHIVEYLFTRYESISQACASTPETLVDSHISLSTACFLSLLFVLYTRAFEQYFLSKDVFSCWDGLLSYCYLSTGFEKKEQLKLFILNEQHHILRHKLLQSGHISSTRICYHQVLDECIQHQAASIILCHNHPSGDPTFSESDITATIDLEKLLSAINVKLHDHIIIGNLAYSSFVEDIAFKNNR